MHKLEEVGTEQTRTIYRRHGVQTELFGVSYKELGKLQKKLKNQHELALQLWDSATHDAMVLACKIADPEKITLDDLRHWIEGCSDYIVTDAFSFFAAKQKTEAALELAEEFIEDEREWISCAGWTIISIVTQRHEMEHGPITHNYLERIRNTIHEQPNRTRYAMNGALIAIGGYIDGAQDEAMEIAQSIGKVQVDHGETGCKTPSAQPYIKKILKRKAEKQSV